MRKKIIIAALINVAVFAIVMTLRHNYELSAEYNFITAKLDIKNGEVKMVHARIFEASALPHFFYRTDSRWLSGEEMIFSAKSPQYLCLSFPVTGRVFRGKK